jgi:short chain dehydrogenase/Protein of unknown function (DUF1566)
MLIGQDNEADHGWTDPETKLTWTPFDNNKDVTWNEAKSFCRTLNFDGHKDWRLPTIDELEAVYDANAPAGLKGPLDRSSDWLCSSTHNSCGGNWGSALFCFISGRRMEHGVLTFRNYHALSVRELAQCFAAKTAKGRSSSEFVLARQLVYGLNQSLDVLGPIIAMQAVIPVMRAQRGGCIVNINSRTAFMTVPQYSVYSFSKRALLGFSLTAQAELEKDCIVVSEIYPFITATNFGNNRIGNPAGGGPPANYASGDTPEFVASLVLQAVEQGHA